MGCFGGGSKSSTTQNFNTTQTQQLNPVANDAIFGQGGLFAGAANLLQNNPIQAYQGPTYAGMNPTQNAALQGTLNYLGMGGGQSSGGGIMAGSGQARSYGDRLPMASDSLPAYYGIGSDGNPLTAAQGAARDAQYMRRPAPGQSEADFLAQRGSGGMTMDMGMPGGAAGGSPFSGGAYAGYNALNSLGSSLMGQQANQISLPGISAQNVSASPVNSSFNFGSVSAPTVDAAGVGGVGVNYQDALTRALSGNVDNPQLRGMMQDTANVSTENFLRNVLPQIRAQSRLAGGFGDSKDAIAQTLGASDLNNSIQRSNTGLLGNLYESAQNRAASTANNLSGQDMQARIASAANQQQSNMANAGFNMQGQLANLQNQITAAQMGQQGQQFNAGQALQAGMANQNAGLQAAGLNQQGLLSAFALNENARQQAIQNQMAGANAINQASQIPLQNYQTALNVGNAYQQDQQGKYTDAYNRFQQNQMLPWQNLGMYQSLIGPYAELGATNTSSGTSSSVTKNSKSPGIFDWVDMWTRNLGGGK